MLYAYTSDCIREAKMKQGKITTRKEGLITVYNCTCETPSVEADEGGYYCINEPKYGLNGCGAVRREFQG